MKRVEYCLRRSPWGLWLPILLGFIIPSAVGMTAVLINTIVLNSEGVQLMTTLLLSGALGATAIGKVSLIITRGNVRYTWVMLYTAALMLLAAVVLQGISVVGFLCAVVLALIVAMLLFGDWG